MSYDTNDLRAMNLDALRKLAIKMGVSGLSKKKKDDVVSALKYRIDHPCKDNKILVDNRCQIPSDIKALSKADMEVIAASRGIKSVKSYNKMELAAKLKTLFECERGDYVNAFTENCASKSPPPSVEESEPEDSGSEDSGSEDSGSEDSGSEDSGSEDSGSEPDTKAKCGLLASKIRKLIDEKIRDIFLNVNLSGLSDSERLEVVEWENNRDDGIRGLEELGCNLSDDEITELTDRYVNDYKQLSGVKRSFCGEVIDYIIDTISQTAFLDKYNSDDLDARDAYWEEDLTPLVESVEATLREEIQNIGCYDITEEDKKNLIDKYEPIISRVFDDYFTKKYPYDSIKSKLRKTTTNDKSGADVDGVLGKEGDWEMKEGNDIQIPCESFSGRSSCEFEFGGIHEGVDLRRCRWNQTSRPGFCEPLPGDLNERLRVTLGQSKAEFAKRQKTNCDWVEATDSDGRLYKYNICDPEQWEWVECDDEWITSEDESGRGFRYNKCAPNISEWLPDEEVEELISEMLVEGGREEAKAMAAEIREETDSEVRKLAMKADETDNYKIMAEMTFANILNDPEISENIKRDARSVRDDFRDVSALDKMLLSRQAIALKNEAQTNIHALDVANRPNTTEQRPKISNVLLQSISRGFEKKKEDDIALEIIEDELSDNKEKYNDSLKQLLSTIKDSDPADKERLDFLVSQSGDKLGLIGPSTCENGMLWDMLTSSCVIACDLSSTVQRGNRCLTYQQDQEERRSRIVGNDEDDEEDVGDVDDWQS
jgi:hypothetical protein